MLCGCIVTKLKNTFDSLVCEFTVKAGEGGIGSRCGCNIFTIGNRSTVSHFCFRSSSIHKSVSVLLVKLSRADGFSLIVTLNKSLYIPEHRVLPYYSY